MVGTCTSEFHTDILCMYSFHPQISSYAVTNTKQMKCTGVKKMILDNSEKYTLQDNKKQACYVSPAGSCMVDRFSSPFACVLGLRRVGADIRVTVLSSCTDECLEGPLVSSTLYTEALCCRSMCGEPKRSWQQQQEEEQQCLPVNASRNLWLNIRYT